MKLVISEKPSAGVAIAAVLGAAERKDGCMQGNGYIVTWCAGHLVELCNADAYDGKYAKWRYGDLPIIPEEWKYLVTPGKERQIEVIRGLMSDTGVDEIICATDAGREGELIFRLVYQHCKCTKPVKRLWVSSMEESAILDGFSKLRPASEYDGLYQSALCRAQADWLIGINATRLFSVLYHDKLNAGRVQSPTLDLIVQREQAIAEFKKEPFFTPELDLSAFTATGERMNDVAAAEAVRAACDGKPAHIISVERKQKTAAPPKLYDLTTLQREANRIYGFTAQQTLDYTQALYEKKLITYPRTDSRYLTEDMRETAGSIVNFLQIKMPYAFAFTPDMARVTDNSKVTDHHAIIPTAEIATADLDTLPAGERDVLDLIFARMLTATAPVHTYEAVTTIIECEGNCFTAKAKTVINAGWKAIDEAFIKLIVDSGKWTVTDDEENSLSTNNCQLSTIKEGQIFQSVSVTVKECFTSPPKSYTEDTLLSAMVSAGHASTLALRGVGNAGDFSGTPDAERKGLGTPATRAGIIEKLVKTGYVERKKKRLLPTEKGVNLIKILPEAIKSPALTSEWEHKLKQVERGELSGAEFMDGIKALISSIVAEHIAPAPEYAALFGKNQSGEIIGVCPRCGMNVREHKKGFFCNNRSCAFALWRDNRFFSSKKKTLTKTIAAALLSEGRVFMSGLYSEKTGKTYDAVVVLDDTGGKYVNFKLDFAKKRTGGNR